MDVVTWLVIGVLGKLAMYMFRKTPFARWTKTKKEFLRELIECDLCLGTWVYAGLFFLAHQDMLSGYIPYLPVVSEVLSGMVTAFVVFLGTSGWRSNFEVIQIDAIH